MSLHLDENQASYQIRGYQPGSIQVNNHILNKSILISSDKLITDWPPQSIEQLTSHDLAIVIDFKPVLLLIGTGAVLQFPSAEVYGDLINAHIGVEIMDTHAACRTFTALTAEGRNVMAALIIT